jgi:anti-sigma factor RsiW
VGEVVRSSPPPPVRRGDLRRVLSYITRVASVIICTVIRTQVSLTEEQMHRLRREARRRHVSLAAVVRDAVDQVVPDEGEARSDRIDALLEVAGSAASGTGDVAREHDEVLAGERW